MAKYVLRRLLQAIPTILGITIISYLIMLAAPGGPVTFMAFQMNPENVTREEMERIAERFGLNDPIPIQYLSWLIGNDWMWWKNVDRDGDGETDPRRIRYGILRGDFGNSFRYTGTSVITLYLSRLPATIELSIASILVGAIIGIPLGVLAAIWRGGKFDNFTRVLAVVGNAVPSFWLGLILLLIFAFTLGILPSGHRCDMIQNSRTGCGVVPVFQRIQYLILPTLVLAFGGIAGYSRFMRTSMLDTISSDYVRTARAKGLPTRSIWLKHAARNALIPIATFIGPVIVSVLSGAVITEKIFSWPGVGLLFIDALTGLDYPLIMASVLLGAVLTVIAFIISDIAYAVFDPRIRF